MNYWEYWIVMVTPHFHDHAEQALNGCTNVHLCPFGELSPVPTSEEKGSAEGLAEPSLRNKGSLEGSHEPSACTIW